MHKTADDAIAEAQAAWQHPHQQQHATPHHNQQQRNHHHHLSKNLNYKANRIHHNRQQQAANVDQLKDVELEFATPDNVHTVGLDTLQEASVKMLNQRNNKATDSSDSSRVKPLQYSQQYGGGYGTQN